MRTTTCIHAIPLVVLLTTGAFAATGGSFDLDWNTVDGGGSTALSGGTFKGGGTIGQPDAEVHSGGTFELVGGFWGRYGMRAAIISGPSATPNPATVNETVQFSAAPNTPDVVFDWNFGDGTAPARGTSVTHAYPTAATYSIVATGTHAGGGVVTGKLDVAVRSSAAAPGLQLLDLVATPSAGSPGVPVTLTAQASNPDGLPLAYTWDFGDGSPAGDGNGVSHQFTAAADQQFTVLLNLSNGVETVSGSLVVPFFAPPPTTAGVANIADGKPEVANPLNGITVKIARSGGGIIELAVDVDALNREAFSVSTEFSGLSGRMGQAMAGTHPVQKFAEAQLAVATCAASEITTKQERGKARKLLALSREETGEPPLVKAKPSRPDVILKTMKGSFYLGRTADQRAAGLAGRNDTVQLSGRIELPEGLEITTAQDVAVGIGNIIDRTSVDAKGKGAATSTLSRVKKLRVKYPKLAKGTTATAAGQTANIDVTLSMADMVGNGFDTEGISAAATDLDPKKKQAARTIQVAVLLGGVAYQAELPVQFKVSSSGETGKIAGRGSP